MFFFQCTGLHVLLKLMGALKKYWLVCVGLLVNHLLHLNFIFLSDGVSEAAE
jgi:hypothetical protein